MKSLGKRFAEKYKVDPDTDCWIWTASAHPTGYGWIRARGKAARAHRVSWELHRGTIPKGMCICHRCDRPSCVNPDHLFIGTQADNMRDRNSKGRWRSGCRDIRGSKNGQSKLTEENVLFIRKKTMKQKDYANIFGVDPTLISQVQARKIWRHLP